MNTVDKKNYHATKIDLRSLPLLANLSHDEIEQIKVQSVEKFFKAKCGIIKTDDLGTTVNFIISGSVHVLNYSASGRAITYASLSEGDLFGEMAAIDGLPRSAWVYSISECHILEIPGKVFMSLAESNHQFALKLLEKLSKNLRDANDRLIQIVSLDVERRACIELMRMAQPDPEDPKIYWVNPMPTQINFANLIGASRETVSRVIGRLKDEQIVKNTTQGLRILDRKRLEKRAFNKLG